MLRIAVLCVVSSILLACATAQPCSGPPPVTDKNMMWDCKRNATTGDANCNVACPPGQDVEDDQGQSYSTVMCTGNNTWPYLACIREDLCNMTDTQPCPCTVSQTWGQWSDCITNCSDPNLQGKMCRFRKVIYPEFMGGGCPDSLSQCRSCDGPTDVCKGPCANTSCLNGGSCTISAENRAICNCPTGAYGRFCESIDPCLQNPCQNGANCTTRFTTPYCACPPGFTGLTCNQTVADVCTPSPCGNGTCVGDFGSPVCQCNAGFFGRWCNDTTAPAPPAVTACNSTALVRCMSNAPVGNSFNKTCGRYQAYGACADSSNCNSIGAIWCDGLFKSETGCMVSQCAAQASSCDADNFATCYEKMKTTKYSSRCDYLVDYVKCGTISTCPDLLKTICTSRQVMECGLRFCPYVVPSPAMVDADALSALLDGHARDYQFGNEQMDESRSSSHSPLVFVGAAMVVAAAAAVAVAIVVRNRRLQGEYHQLATVATH